jgi:hypothetical protein
MKKHLAVLISLFSWSCGEPQDPSVTVTTGAYSYPAGGSTCADNSAPTTPGTFKVFSYTNFQGSCDVFPTNPYQNIPQLAFYGWSGQIQSVRTGPEAYVDINSMEYFNGTNTYLWDSTDYPDLTGSPLAQSMVAETAVPPGLPPGSSWYSYPQPDRTVEVCTDPGLSGNCITVNNDTFFATYSASPAWNWNSPGWGFDTIRSVGPSYPAFSPPSATVITTYPCGNANCTYNGAYGYRSPPVNTTGLNVQSLSVWSFQSGIFQGQNFNEPPNDWDYSFYKGTCSSSFGVTGISINTSNGQEHAIFCRSNGGFGSGTYYGSQAHVVALTGVDERWMSRSVNGNSDWDHGYLKHECDHNQYVSGLSTYGPFHAIRCSYDSGFGDANCSARVVNAGEDRGSPDAGDWDKYYWKTDCAPNEYMAGVSADKNTYLVHAILCCPR